MKLHELLAVAKPLNNQADTCRAELAGTFEKKRHLFSEKRKTFTPLGEGQVPVTEEQSTLQTTAPKEFDWIAGHLTKAWDGNFQIAEANMIARADIVLEDEKATVLASDVPATALLELEKEVAEVIALLKAVPTLDPALGFSLDASRELGVHKAREVQKPRTQKTKKVFIKYDATKEHPAQTELLDQDVVIGHIQEQEWSGLITPALKADLLDRAEMLARAVRRARARANDTIVDNKKKIGGKLLSFVFKGAAA